MSQSQIAFTNCITSILKKLETLKEFADNHLNVEAEDVRWCNVGDASSLADSLALLCRAFELKVKE